MNPGFNLKAIAAHLSEKDLWSKALADFSEADIMDLCQIVCLAAGPGAAYRPPYINDSGDLVIPHDAPAQYKWWDGGQPIIETLAELGANEATLRRYRHQEKAPYANFCADGQKVHAEMWDATAYSKHQQAQYLAFLKTVAALVAREIERVKAAPLTDGGPAL